MTVAGLIASFVPRPCTREQAQGAEKRLRLVIDVIWFVHGEAMACVLLGAPQPARTAPTTKRSRSSSLAAGIQRLVPVGWTGKQALRAVSVVEIAIEAVWDVHLAENEAQVEPPPQDELPF